MKILFYDIETTGTRFWKNGIHQMSGAIVIDGEVKETFDFRVQPNPKALIEQAALDVGGVTVEQIMAYPPMGDIYHKFVTMLGKYVEKFNRNDKFYLAGYNNAQFDNQFLRAWFVQNGDQFFGSWFWSNSIDVMVLATQYLIDKRPAMENFKLSTVAKACGIDVEAEALHDALYDITLTKKVYDIVTAK
jgi:DNA polymerase III subunit epsilon